MATNCYCDPVSTQSLPLLTMANLFAKTFLTARRSLAIRRSHCKQSTGTSDKDIWSVKGWQGSKLTSSHLNDGKNVTWVN